jgi:hypothetical protein
MFMLSKRVAVGLIALSFTVMSLSPAFADDDDDGWKGHKRHKQYRHYGGDVVYVERPPVYVVPQPRVIYVEPEPAYVWYPPPRPRVAYYPPPGVSLTFNFD